MLSPFKILPALRPVARVFSRIGSVGGIVLAGLGLAPASLLAQSVSFVQQIPLPSDHQFIVKQSSSGAALSGAGPTFFLTTQTQIYAWNGQSTFLPVNSPLFASMTLLTTTQVAPLETGNGEDFFSTGAGNTLYRFNQSAVLSSTVLTGSGPVAAALAVGSNGVPLVAGNGLLYTIDANSGNATRIAGDGSVVVGGDGLAVGPNGLAYSLDATRHVVRSFDPAVTDGSSTSFRVPADALDMSIGAAPGHIYLGTAAGGGYVYDLSGNFLQAFSPPVGATPTAAAVNGGVPFLNIDSAGNIFVYTGVLSGQGGSHTDALYEYHDAQSAPLPAITALSRSNGPAAGGYSVTLTGSGLAGAIVRGPGIAITDFTAASPTSLTFVMPAATPGTVDLRVTNAYGTSALTAADKFTFNHAPTVTAVSPSFGPVSGGGAITLSGTGLNTVTAVSVGGAPVTSFTAQSATAISLLTPAGAAGTVDLIATSPDGGTSDVTPSDEFTYLSVPVVTALSLPASPTAGGESLTVTGINLANATVSIGGVAVTTLISDTATSITFLTPPGTAGATVDVTVTTVSGTSGLTPADQLVYTDLPFIGAFSPTLGSSNGGDTVTITGINLAGATSVQFNGVEATILANTATSITVRTPAFGGGGVPISVTAAAGTNDASLTGFFVGNPPPTVTSASVAFSPLAGGPMVTITGSGLDGNVSVGSTPVTHITTRNIGGNAPSVVTFPLPAMSAGVYDITLTKNGVASVGTPADQVTYTGLPVVMGISPALGSIHGGGSVTITGINLGSPVVHIGSGTVSAFSSNTPTSLTFTLPPGPLGVEDVTVTTSAGTSATSAADQFTYTDQVVVTGVSPAFIPLAGQEVTITGVNLQNAFVTVGSLAATSYTSNGPTAITFPAPAQSAGVYDITAQSANRLLVSATSPADQIAYSDATVTGVSPQIVSRLGGMLVTVTGSFGGRPSVSIGSTPVTAAFTSNSPQSLTFPVPALAQGTYDITVASSNGPISAISPADRITVSALPVVTGISPPTSPTSGGVLISVKGANLVPIPNAPNVRVGNRFINRYVSNSPTLIRFTAPANSLGVYDVLVGGGSSGPPIPADRLTYTNAPTVTGVSPAFGSVNGGDRVTIAGFGLLNATVQAGGTTIASLISNSDTSITFLTPPGADGAVDLTVTTPYGPSAVSAADVFTYTDKPFITGVSPAIGTSNGGDSVTVTGGNFDNLTDLHLDQYVTGYITANTSTSITFTTPGGSAGTFDIRVYTAFGFSDSVAADLFTYTSDPVITGVSPLVGSSAGGDYVTVTGLNLGGLVDVLVGGTPSPSIIASSPTSFTFVTPAGSAGTASISVDTGSSSGQSPIPFTYVDPPAVTGVSPKGGLPVGGGSVTITGDNFTQATAVQFGPVLITNFALNASGSITFPAPASLGLATGPVDVTVTTLGGTSAITGNDVYTYAPVPTVTGVSPGTTLATGGESLTITGTDFTNATSVQFGADVETNFTLNGPSRLKIPAPVLAAGVVDITVTTPSGTSATSASDRLTLVTPPVLSPGTLTAATAGAAYSQTFSVAGGTAPFTFLVTAGSLPAGLALSSDGHLTGTPTAGGSFNFDVTATDSSASSGPYTAAVSYSLTVNAAVIVVSPSTLPGGTVATAYSQSLGAAGGTAAYGFAVTAGSLPAGVTLASSGVLSGTPTAGGTFNFTVTATDHSTGTGPFTGSRAYSLVIAAPTLAVGPSTIPTTTQGVAFSQTITGSGGTAPRTFAVTAGSLPTGVTLATSGALTGTPSVNGAFNFTVTATDSSTGTGPYTGSRAYAWTVNAPLAIAPASLAAATAGTATTQTITVSHGTTPYTTLTVTSFAAGTTGLTALMLTPNAGAGTVVLSGTPTSAGSATFTVNATDTVGATAIKNYTVVVNPALSIAPGALLAATAGTATNQTITVSNGTTPYTALTVTSFVAGTTGLTSLMLTPNAGAGTVTLSGTPTTAGSATFTVNATDTAGATLTKNYTVTVNAALSIAPSALAGATAGTATNQTITISNGTTPYTALAVANFAAGTTALTAGALTTNLAAGTVTLSGTPSSAGSATFTVNATDTAGATLTQNYTLTVNPALTIAPAALGGATVGTATTRTITVSNGTTPYASVSVAAFAAGTTGLATPTVSGNTVTLSGTPSAAGTATFTVNVLDAAGATLTKNYTLTVNPVLSIAPASLLAATAGTATNQTITVSGGTTPYTLLNVTGLSAGTTGLTVGMLTATAGTGTVVLSGTPAGAGTATFTVNATDTAGATLTKNYTLTVNSALSIAPVSLAPATTGAATNQTITVSNGTAPYTGLTVTNFSAGATGLTSGALTATASSGTVVLNGTPTGAGTATFTVNVTDTAGATATKSYTLTVNILSIAPALLAPATSGAAANQTITVGGGTAPYTALTVTGFSAGTTGLTSAALTPNLGAGTVVLSGTPTGAGTAAFTVNVTDTAGGTLTKAYTLTVNAALAIGPASLAPATALGLTHQTITVTQGTSPYTSLTVTGFDAGTTGLTSGAFTATPALGTVVLSGTPSAGGTASFTVNVADTARATASKSYSLTVNPPLSIGPTALATAVITNATHQTITVTGGTAPYTSLSVSNFVAGTTGLTFGAFTATAGTGTVVLSGTPSGVGSATFTVNVTDTAGATQTRDYTLTVVAKATATVALGNLSATYDGTIKLATVTTVPPGLAVLYTYNGTPLAITPPGGSIAAYGGAIGQTLYLSVTGATTGTIYGGNGTASGNYGINSDVPTAAVHAGVLTSGQSAVIQVNVLPDQGPYAGSLANAVTSQSESTGGGAFQIVGIVTTGFTTGPVAAGSYTVVATIWDSAYQGTATDSLVIGQAATTVTWATPAAIVYGTPLSAAQLNATASVPGTFGYNYAIGTIFFAGAPTLTVAFTPTDTTDYATATGSTVLTVNQAVPIITWAAPAAITYGTTLSGTQLNATPSVAGSFAYNPAAGTAPAPGTQTLTATFTPLDARDYATVTATTTLAVGPAVPAIVWLAPAAITYGVPLSATQLNATATLAGSPVAGTFTYNPAAGAVLPAGSQTLGFTFTPNDTAHYSTVNGSTLITVNKTTPTIGWPVPAAITYGTKLSATQLNAAVTSNSTTVPGMLVYTPDFGTMPPANTLPLPLPLTLKVAFTPTDTANYNSANGSTSLTVNPATPLMRWAVPAAISYGTALSATQLSATVTENGAPAVGTLTFTPALGTVLNGGVGQTLRATFAPTDAVDFTTISGTVSLDVVPASQTITFPAITGARIGDVLTLRATASSGLPVTFRLVSGNAAFDGVATLSLNDGNTVIVSASVAATANYQSATTSLAITAGSKKGQSITFPGIDQHLTTDRPFTLSAAADSGLAIVYSLVSGPAIVSGSTVVLTGGTGTVTVQASQPGDAVYQPAAPVSLSFAVVAPPVAVSFFGSTAGTGGSSSGDAVRVVLNGITLHAVATSNNIAATLAADGTRGVLIGFLPTLNQGFVLKLAPDGSGHYSGTTPTMGGTGAPVTLTIAGTATLAGVSGTIQPLGLTFGAVADPTTGPTAGISGIYQSSNLNGASGSTYSVVGSQGEVFVLAVTPTAVASGTGTVNATTGTFAVQATPSVSVAGSINAAASTVSGTVATVGGSTVNFSGASNAVTSTNVLVNMSSRGTVSPGLPLIVGFVVNGAVSKTVVLRGVGPGLVPFGLAGALAVPELTLYDAGAHVLSTNAGWGGTASLSSAFTQVGAFGLPAGSLDTALETTLAPGAYTIVISDGANDAGGPALAEIYDASIDPSETTQRLVNVSSRGQVTAANPLIAGFVVSGNSPKKVLIRAVGPGLTAFGVTNVLVDPVLTVNDASSTAIAQNNDWGTALSLNAGQTIATAADIAAAASVAGAFPLVPGSKDAATVMVLAPGNYTAVVTGAGGSAGAALVEVYELPSP